MITLEKLAEIAGIETEDISHAFRFGSRVYGSAQPDSDHDFIIVASHIPEKGRIILEHPINIHIYTPNEFQRAINSHDIAVLECLFLSKEHILKAGPAWTFDLHKGHLRKSISMVCSNSYVKGKKKLIIIGDYDKWLAIKSVYHSMRIQDLGIQLAAEGRISDYSKYNWLLEELIKLAGRYDRDELWELIDSRYRSLYNKLRSEFKSLCPKDLIEAKGKEAELKNFLKSMGVELKPGLMKGIMKIFD